MDISGRVVSSSFCSFRSCGLYSICTPKFASKFSSCSLMFITNTLSSVYVYLCVPKMNVYHLSLRCYSWWQEEKWKWDGGREIFGELCLISRHIFSVGAKVTYLQAPEPNEPQDLEDTVRGGV